MKKLVIVVIAALLLFCVNSYAADSVGFINVQKLVSSSEMGKKATVEIQKLRDTENVKISTRRDELEKMKDTFKSESQKKDADREELRVMIDKIQIKEKEFKRIVDDANEMLAKKDRELVIEILLKADPILKDIAKQKGYSVILKDRNVLAYLDPKVDITDEVVAKLK